LNQGLHKYELGMLNNHYSIRFEVIGIVRVVEFVPCQKQYGDHQAMELAL
jgi:hypothetical protein